MRGVTQIDQSFGLISAPPGAAWFVASMYVKPKFTYGCSNVVSTSQRFRFWSFATLSEFQKPVILQPLIMSMPGSGRSVPRIWKPFWSFVSALL